MESLRRRGGYEVNWEAVGAIAEMLGAVAVFLTLAYLAVQVRQSNIVTREQAQYHASKSNALFRQPC